MYFIYMILTTLTLLKSLPFLDEKINIRITTFSLFHFISECVCLEEQLHATIL
ncbi:unnamed protein product, partial [Gulo gulo]